MENVKYTPLYEEHVHSDGKIIDFAGWALPVQYSGIVEEHEAVRHNAGLFDVSHMGEITVKGPDAEKFVHYLVTNHVLNLENGKVLYTFMCYEHGGVVDDLLVYKTHGEDILLVVNASNVDKDYDWIKEKSKGFDVEVANMSVDISQIAIQGPKAEKILQSITSEDLSKIGFFEFKKDVELFGHKALVSRTGYTGEDGFEIYLSNDIAKDIWNKLLEKGKDYGLVPAGLGARDTLRFEAALPLYGNEISQSITPLEAGFGMFVKLDKDDFIGKEALADQKSQGLKRKVVGFQLKKKGVTRHGYPILSEEGEEIGTVTTGYYLPSTNKSIGLGLIDINYAKLGTPIQIQIRKKAYEAEVVSKKFMDKNYKK